MRKLLIVLLVVCGCALFAAPGWSLVILTDPPGIGIEVGSVDDWVFTFESGSETYEAQQAITWIAGDTGTSESSWTMTKVDNSGTWYEVGANTSVSPTAVTTYAMDLPIDDAAYFYLKLGNLTPGETPTDPCLLYENLDSLLWAVVDIQEWSDEWGSIANIGKVSHYGYTGGTSVPEPATMFLLGTGLIGLALFGRQRFKK
jgi:hypothetical protein